MSDRFYIGGRWVLPLGDETTTLLDPATEQPIATVPVPSVADAERAIEAARAAFDEGPWPSMKPSDRAARLRRAGEILRARQPALEELLTTTVGATLALVKTVQVDWAIEVFELAAEWAESFAWERPVEPRSAFVRVGGIAVREPVGVVTGMTPFNYPFFVNCWKVAPPIALGNTVVLKPSPWTPLDAFEIARACEEADIPPGVVNVIGGGGIEVGEVLAGHPMVDMVSFTGSVGGGRAVGALAMRTVKKVQLELGGKSAAIMLDDADPRRSAAQLMGACMMHAGQGCGCTTRLLVPEALHDATVEALVEACAALTIGDPRDPSTVLGPLIRDEHRARVEAYVDIAVSEGGTVACGGRRPDRPGFFYEPTVLTGVRNDMRVAQEEIFGPVLAVIPYASLDDAVTMANDSIFGLGGAVLTPDRDRAVEVARRLRTGFVGVNGGMLNFNGSWGGYKQSGVGREWKLGLDEFTELKYISWIER